MNTLGLIGGMSWESTAVYYRRLNTLVRERLGGQHSASLVMMSFDFAPIVEMQAAGDWNSATALMTDAARRLEAAGAQGLMICANTMHLMAGAVAASVEVPLIHVTEATARAIREGGHRRPLLLGTRFTMEQPFYRQALEAAGLDPCIPPEDDRAVLHAIIYDELVQGRLEPRSREAMITIVGRAMREQGADCAILGCTEFGLLLAPGDLPIPMFDTTEIHARAGVAFMLGS